MALADNHRRVIANLAIPRNVDNVAQRVLGFAPLNAADIDKLLRGELSDKGYVVNLGEHADAAKLASKVQAHKQLIPMADEQAEIYTRRMQAPHLRWRLGGEQWMLTKDGLDAIKAPIENEPDPLTPSQVQSVVDREWARVHHDKLVPGETSLAEKLLPDEFMHWYQLVADDCEKRWGVRPVAPIAGGASGYADAYEIALLDAENQKTALGAVVDPWYMTLSILGFTDADTGTTADDGSHKPTYTGYARKSVAGTDMNAGSGAGGSVTNANAITFAACTVSSSVIIGFGNTSALTVGTLRKWGDCTSTTVSTTQTPPQFAVGAYTTTTT